MKNSAPLFIFFLATCIFGCKKNSTNPSTKSVLRFVGTYISTVRFTHTYYDHNIPGYKSDTTYFADTIFIADAPLDSLAISGADWFHTPRFVLDFNNKYIPTTIGGYGYTDFDEIQFTTSDSIYALHEYSNGHSGEQEMWTFNAKK